MKTALLFTLTCCAVLHAETLGEMLDTVLKKAVPEISTEELVTALKGENPPVLLDTRAVKEYEVSHLEGAKRFGYIKVDYALLAELDPETEVVLYGTVGKRSEDIGTVLQRKGFTKVKNLRGGIIKWANEKRPLFDKDGEATESVHIYMDPYGKWLEPHVTKVK